MTSKSLISTSELQKTLCPVFHGSRDKNKVVMMGNDIGMRMGVIQRMTTMIIIRMSIAKHKHKPTSNSDLIARALYCPNNFFSLSVFWPEALAKTPFPSRCCSVFGGEGGFRGEGEEKMEFKRKKQTNKMVELL